QGDAVVARVDVHKIGLQRGDHEVADAKAEQILVEGQSSLDVWEGQKRVAHTLRAGTEAGDVAARLEGGVGDLGAVEGFQTIAGRVNEGDQARHAALVSQRSGFAFHGDAGGFEAGGERVKCRGVGDFPAEDLGTRYEGPVDK